MKRTANESTRNDANAPTNQQLSKRLQIKQIKKKRPTTVTHSHFYNAQNSTKMSCTRDFVHHKYTAIILWYIRHKWWTLSTYARNHFTHFKQTNMCVFAFYGRDYMNASNRICIAYACSYYRFHPNTRLLYWSSQFSACKANEIFLHDFYEYLIFAVSNCNDIWLKMWVNKWLPFSNANLFIFFHIWFEIVYQKYVVCDCFCKRWENSRWTRRKESKCKKNLKFNNTKQKCLYDWLASIKSLSTCVPKIDLETMANFTQKNRFFVQPTKL